MMGLTFRRSFGCVCTLLLIHINNIKNSEATHEETSINLNRTYARLKRPDENEIQILQSCRVSFIHRNGLYGSVNVDCLQCAGAESV